MITIEQASSGDIAVLERVLLDTVTWLNDKGTPLWGASEVTWDALSKKYSASDFYLAYLDGAPAGCMALIEDDPFFWPDVPPDESLFLHKLAVTKAARKLGVSDALMDFSKSEGVRRGKTTLRLDTHALRPKVRAFYERHGFRHVGTKVLLGKYHTAFYEVDLHSAILTRNKNSWNAIADSFFGVTALPAYGCLCPGEDELRLFPDLTGKAVLDIGCGSGHSLLWCGRHGASELWGLDMSDRQTETAERLLRGHGYAPTLFCSPMEQNPGLPPGYFDVVYSIYAIGWTVDLQRTFTLIASYLKPGGIFIFSWDHPFLHCVEAVDEKLVFSGNYYEPAPFNFRKLDNPMTLYNRRLCDYVNALAAAGLAVERMVEETDKETLSRDAEFSSAYYAPGKAKRFPLSLIVKAKRV
ncbi:MAG: GNAT family N-acetyltransferase [Oscillospiraceae bacterium]|jgi:SAM-dependent methyltransferase/GNAT superfamily N-acetyltransferase|nr:GNAT family N-acetyltransferase [Oscillospiraceae bacterium]